MIQEVTQSNLDFFKLRNEESNVFKNCNKAQEITIQHLLNGKSYSYIAREVFNVHYNTLLSNCKSISYIQALSKANDSLDLINMELCRKKLTEIITKSNNENCVLKAIQIYQNFNQSVKLEEIYNSLKTENNNKEDAKNVLESLGIAVAEEEVK